MEYNVVDMLAVHGVILFVLLGTGVLVLLNVRWWRAVLQPQHVIPAFFVMAFVISLLVNTAMGMAFSFLGVPFGYAVVVLLVVHAVLMIRFWRQRKTVAGLFRGAMTRAVLALLIWVALMFAFMVSNGGLIDILADSWWHMSLAKKIEFAGSVFLERHHLTGAAYASPRIAYEPGWHLSLVYVLTMTELPAPLIWHALAPWCVALTLCAYFLLAERITRNAVVAVFAVILMALLLGGLNSYFRVSPWPGNVSYVLWYFLLFVSFRLLEMFADSRAQSDGPVSELAFVKNAISDQRVLVLLWVLCIAAIAAIHIAELLWYALSILFYGIVLLGLDMGRQKSDTLIMDRALLGRFVFVLVYASVIPAWLGSGGVYSIIVIFIAVMTLVLLHGQAYRLGNRQWAAKLLIWASLIGGFVYLVDIDHVAALFYPRPESSSYYARYIPEWKLGSFGEYVRVAFWEHQLRAGLLFSGLTGVAAAVYLFFRRPGRGTGFLFGNAVIPVLLLTTPYLFSYLFYFMPEHGVYRISLLIFHPICIAYAVYCLLADMGILKSYAGNETHGTIST